MSLIALNDGRTIEFPEDSLAHATRQDSSFRVEHPGGSFEVYQCAEISHIQTVRHLTTAEKIVTVTVVTGVAYLTVMAIAMHQPDEAEDNSHGQK